MMTKRQITSPESLALSIKGHLVVDVRSVLATVEHFLETYEMPSGVVRNMQASRKELQRAMGSMLAAQTVAELEAYGEDD